MRLSERLAKNNLELEKKKKRRRGWEDEEEDTMTYKPVMRTGYLNDKKSAFPGFGDNGINNAPSIFDRGAVFDTRQD